MEASTARKVEELARSELETVAVGRMDGKRPPSNPGSGHQRLSFPGLKIPEVKKKRPKLKGKK